MSRQSAVLSSATQHAVPPDLAESAVRKCIIRSRNVLTCSGNLSQVPFDYNAMFKIPCEAIKKNKI